MILKYHLIIYNIIQKMPLVCFTLIEVNAAACSDLCERIIIILTQHVYCAAKTLKTIQVLYHHIL